MPLDFTIGGMSVFINNNGSYRRSPYYICTAGINHGGAFLSPFGLWRFPREGAIQCFASAEGAIEFAKSFSDEKYQEPQGTGGRIPLF